MINRVLQCLLQHAIWNYYVASLAVALQLTPIEGAHWLLRTVDATILDNFGAFCSS